MHNHAKTFETCLFSYAFSGSAMPSIVWKISVDKAKILDFTSIHIILNFFLKYFLSNIFCLADIISNLKCPSSLLKWQQNLS